MFEQWLRNKIIRGLLFACLFSFPSLQGEASSQVSKNSFIQKILSSFSKKETSTSSKRRNAAVSDVNYIDVNSELPLVSIELDKKLTLENNPSTTATSSNVLNPPISQPEVKIAEETSDNKVVVAPTPSIDQTHEHPLIEILKQVAVNAPEIQAPLYRYRVAQSETAIEKSNTRHRFDLASNWSSTQEHSPSSVDRLTEGRIGLQFQKKLWDPPAEARLESAKWSEKEQEARLEADRQRYLELTCRLYLNLFRQQNTLELAKLNRGVNFDNFVATSDRFQEGELTRTDKELSSTRFNVSKAVLVDAEYQQALTDLEYQKITGRPAPKELVLFELDANHKLMQVLASGNQSFIYYEEIAAEAAKVSQEFRYKVAQYNQWPILSLNAESAFLEETGSLSSRVDWEHSIGVSFNIPLFRGGYYKFDRSQEHSRYKILESQYEIIKKQKEFDIKQVLSTLVYYQDLTKYYLLAEKSADEMVKGFREEYLAGTRTSTDLLDAENERFTVKVRRLNSELDFTLTQLSLLRIHGLIDIGHLSMLIKTAHKDG